MTYKTTSTIAVGLQSAFKNFLKLGQFSTSLFGGTNKVEAITRIGKLVTDAAEILQANLSWRDEKWNDHATQCILPNITATQMAPTKAKPWLVGLGE